MRLILLGPPGAGKGTQAKKLSEKFEIPAVSMGEKLRGDSQKDTRLGQRIKEYMKKGVLVPDHLLFDIVEKLLDDEDLRNGFILDGFPRTIVQAETLTGFLKKRDLKLGRVIYIVLEPDNILERLSQRRVCGNCGIEYHLTFKPPKKDGLCDQCSERLIERLDDKKEIIQKRIEVYFRDTVPLVEYYRQKGSLLEVSGKGGIEEVFNGIVNGLASLD
jgi:adenylate kinase